MAPIKYGISLSKRVVKSDILFLRLGKHEKAIMRKLKVTSDASLRWKCSLKEPKSWKVHVVVGKYYVSIGWYNFVEENNIKPGDYVRITIQSPSLFLMEIVPSSYYANSPATKKCTPRTAIACTPPDSSNSAPFESFESEEKTQTAATSSPAPHSLHTTDTKMTLNTISTSIETTHQMPVPAHFEELPELIASVKKTQQQQEDAITFMNGAIININEAITSMNDAISDYKSQCLMVKDTVQKLDKVSRKLWM